MVVKYFVLPVTNKIQDIEITTQLIRIIPFALNKATFLDEYLTIHICLKCNRSFSFDAQNVEIAMALNANAQFHCAICCCYCVVRMLLLLMVYIWLQWQC